jgi:hypothetical protein
LTANVAADFYNKSSAHPQLAVLELQITDKPTAIIGLTTYSIIRHLPIVKVAQGTFLTIVDCNPNRG